MKSTQFFSATSNSVNTNNTNNSSDVPDNIKLPDEIWYAIFHELANTSPSEVFNLSVICKDWDRLVNFKEKKDLSIKEKAFCKILNNKYSLLKKLDPAIDEHIAEIYQGILKEKTDFSEIAITFDCLVAESLKINFTPPESYQKPTNFDALAKTITDSTLAEKFKFCSKKDRQKIVDLMEVGFHLFSLVNNETLTDKKKTLIKNANQIISNEEIVPYKDQCCFKTKNFLWRQKNLALLPTVFGLVCLFFNAPIPQTESVSKKIKTDLLISGIILVSFAVMIYSLNIARKCRNNQNKQKQKNAYHMSEFFLNEVVVDSSSSDQINNDQTNNLPQLTNS